MTSAVRQLGRADSAESTIPAKPIVVGLGAVPAEVVAPILGAGTEFIANPGREDIARATAAIVRASAIIGPDELAQMPNIRLLVRTGVGYDTIDIDAARQAGIGVGITPGTNAKAVAEGAFGHILHLVKSLGPFTDLIRRGGWAERTNHVVGDLEGATLGIIGYGRIGRRMHSIASAFDMSLLAFDPVAEIPAEVSAGKDEVIAKSDIISVHVPLLPATRNLISTAEIAAMRPGTILINVSRGGIVDLDAALAGLESGHLGGVGLDTFDPEPAADHPLHHHEKVVLSPHMMGVSTRSIHASFVVAAQSIRSFLDGGSDYTLVNAD